MSTITLVKVPTKTSFVPKIGIFSNVCVLNSLQVLLQFHKIFLKPACLFLCLVVTYFSVFDLQQSIIEESGSAIAQFTLRI